MRTLTFLFLSVVSFSSPLSNVRAQNPDSDGPVVITRDLATDPQGGRADVLAIVGDVNGDALPDIAVGYSRNPALSMVSVVESRSGRDVWSISWPAEGDSTTASSVWDIESIRDVDDDGVDDILVGAYSSHFDRADQSRVYVVSGRNGDILRRLTAPEPERADFFGYDISVVDDLNGDGIREIGIGSMNGGTGGRVYVYDGMTWEAIYSWDAPDTAPKPSLGGRFGESVANVGDLNGDGVGEIAVGASYDLDGRGTVSVYDGLAGGLLYRIESPVFDQWAGFGSEVAAIGDVNADGIADFAVGAPYSGSDDTGKVFVFSGSDGSLYQELSADILRQNGYFGVSISSVQDFDDDGVPDILVAAPGGSSGGAWYIESGRTGDTITRKHSPNRQAGGQFGRSAVSASRIVGVLAPFEESPRLYIYKYGEDPPAPFAFGTVYPNPTTDTVTLRVSLPQDGSYELTVLDALGRSVHRKRVRGTAGANDVPISLRRQTAGIYTILVEAEADFVIGRVTVIR